MDSSEELVVLHYFFDAFEAGKACQFLEEGQIPFELKDYSVRLQGVVDRFEAPAVHLDVLVSSEDLERAKSCLREKMGLFPEREVDERGECISADDEEMLSSAIVTDDQQEAHS